LLKVDIEKALEEVDDDEIVACLNNHHITRYPHGLYRCLNSARSCRGSGKILLKLEFQRKYVADAFEYLSSRLRFGQGPRGMGRGFVLGREYLIKYRDFRGKIGERRTRVLAIQKETLKIQREVY